MRRAGPLLLAALLAACAEEAAPYDCALPPASEGGCEVKVTPGPCDSACTAEGCKIAYASCKLAPFRTAPDYRACAQLYSECART